MNQPTPTRLIAVRTYVRFVAGSGVTALMLGIFICTAWAISVRSDAFQSLFMETPVVAGGASAHTAQATLIDPVPDRKSTRLNSSHGYISYAVFCLKKKKTKT